MLSAVQRLLAAPALAAPGERRARGVRQGGQTHPLEKQVRRGAPASGLRSLSAARWMPAAGHLDALPALPQPGVSGTSAVSTRAPRPKLPSTLRDRAAHTHVASTQHAPVQPYTAGARTRLASSVSSKRPPPQSKDMFTGQVTVTGYRS
jgi:hypothetical protein